MAGARSHDPAIVGIAAMTLIVALTVGCGTPAADRSPTAALPPSSTASATATAAASVVPSLAPVPVVGNGEPWIAYQSWTSDTTHIGLMRQDGSGGHRLEFDGLKSDDVAHPAWTPNGERILAREADWDPAGPRIVLTLVDSLVPDMDHARLAVANADGSDLRLPDAASGSAGGAFHPSWDPGGKWISFVHVESSGTRRIARIRPDGMGMELLQRSSDVRTHPRARPTP